MPSKRTNREGTEQTITDYLREHDPQQPVFPSDVTKYLGVSRQRTSQLSGIIRAAATRLGLSMASSEQILHRRGRRREAASSQARVADAKIAPYVGSDHTDQQVAALTGFHPYTVAKSRARQEEDRSRKTLFRRRLIAAQTNQDEIPFGAPGFQRGTEQKSPHVQKRIAKAMETKTNEPWRKGGKPSHKRKD